MTVKGQTSDRRVRGEAANRSLEPRRRYAWAFVAAVTIAVDQATKAAAFDYVGHSGIINMAPFLAIRTGMNSGVAFGLATQAHPVVLVTVAAAISFLLLVLIWRSRSPLERTGLGMILGGAIGNIADRLRFGAVRDFIDFHWGAWHWPAFNLADAFITLGVLILLVASISDGRKQPLRPNAGR